MTVATSVSITAAVTIVTTVAVAIVVSITTTDTVVIVSAATVTAAVAATVAGNRSINDNIYRYSSNYRCRSHSVTGTTNTVTVAITGATAVTAAVTVNGNITNPTPLPLLRSVIPFQPFRTALPFWAPTGI